MAVEGPAIWQRKQRQSKSSKRLSNTWYLSSLKRHNVVSGKVKRGPLVFMFRRL
jgi:hypothetical protein